jgi:hypothetical protein
MSLAPAAVAVVLPPAAAAVAVALPPAKYIVDCSKGNPLDEQLDICVCLN